MVPRPDVLVLGLNYPPEPTGIAPYTGSLATRLSDKGHRVSALVGHPHYPEWKIRDGYGRWTQDECLNGVSVRRLLHYVPLSPRGIRRLVSEISFGARLVLTRWNRPRVIVAISPSLFSSALALLRLRLTRRRPQFVLWVQDIYTLGIAETGEGNGLAHRITGWVESRTFRAADRVVVIHKRFADLLTQEFGVPEQRVVIVRNWTHLPPSEPIDAHEAKGKLGWPDETTLAVHTGNMGVKQGLENVVDAARLADEMGAPVHFMLVGDGGERRTLEERAQGIVRLSFIDPLNDASYRLALSAADVLIVNEKPGVAAMAVPSKLTSYFDAGRPVIAATDPAGITASEIAAAGAGVIVQAGRPADLLQAVTAIRSEPEQALRYGSNGRRYRETVLDESTAIQQWIGLIDDASAHSREDGPKAKSRYTDKNKNIAQQQHE